MLYPRKLPVLSLLFAVALLLAACGTGDSAPDTDTAGSAESQMADQSEENDKTSEADSENLGADIDKSSSPDGGDENTGVETPEQSFAGNVPAPEFPPVLDWINTSTPLSIADLRGKVVLLDFWTYGCINCLHVIPDLKALEEKYADELVVIGVHSAKFENEGETKNIENIVQRYELEHPVVNDNQFQIWSQYGARAWPTLVIIDPIGNVLGYHAGEGIYDQFDFIIGGMIEEFDELGLVDRSPVASITHEERKVESPLLFPGKVLADVEGDRLYIADSNHNRIVIADFDGTVLDVIGDGQTRLKDGDYENSSFFRPQGMALSDQDSLYVADTENNAIRLVNLVEKKVDTIAGTGEQAYTRIGEADAKTTPLNSPWDVLYYDGLLYIAMAGQHQIWSLDPDSGKIKVFAGSGREELRDGDLLLGGLNQPSGLSTDGTLLYFADSEASAIRTAELDADGQLSTIVGTGLFDFGDQDGKGDAVRLQHPLGVAYGSGQLYVADTYNSKIKIINPESRESTSYLGGDESGWRDGTDALFNEPGGIALGGDKLYIADTNNHVIRVADLGTGEVSTLVLIDQDRLLTRQVDGSEYTGKTINLEPQVLSPGLGIISLSLELPEGYKINDIAPFSMEWSATGDIAQFDEEDVERQIVEPQFPVTFPAEFESGEGVITGDLIIYFCETEAQSLCLIERVRINAPVSVSNDGVDALTVSYAVPDPEN